jgi:hypothetical protein
MSIFSRWQNNMNLRPLDILDVPTLARYRNLAVLLDTARALTRGNPLGAAGFMSYFNPARHIYTGVMHENGTTLLGSIIHTNGDSFAKLVYLAPVTQLNHAGLPILIDYLCGEAAKWGAFHVLAELDETNDAFSALRQTGFSVYAWQRIWDVSHIIPGPANKAWVRARSVHLSAIQSLHHEIVPPLLQPVEQAPKHTAGFICMDDMKCYVHLTHGRVGVLLTPLIHPEVRDVATKLASLLNHLPQRYNRPVYLCIRSYQAWLEPVLEDLGGKPATQRQAVMVKHLAHTIKDEQAVRAAQPAVSVQPSQIRLMERKK